METDNGMIVVTGSSGFIGKQLVERLLSNGYRVIGLDCSVPIVSNVPEFNPIHCDFRSQESIDLAFNQIMIQFGPSLASVIHLAGHRNLSYEQSFERTGYDEIDIMGTERLLGKLKQFKVGQFILSSTMFVHRRCEIGEQIDEDWPVDPLWAAPKAKLKCEDMVKRQKELMPIVILRLAEIYDDSCRSALLSHQIQSIYEQHLNGVIYPGDISKGKTCLHMDDLIEALLQTIKKRTELPRELTLLLGEPHTLSHDYLQRFLGRLIHNQEWQTYSIPNELVRSALWLKDKLPLLSESFIKSWMVHLADHHFALDTSRAKMFLHWQPERSLDRMLAKMIFQFKADPQAWYEKNGLTAPFWLQREHYFATPIELKLRDVSSEVVPAPASIDFA